MKLTIVLVNTIGRSDLYWKIAHHCLYGCFELWIIFANLQICIFAHSSEEFADLRFADCGLVHLRNLQICNSGLSTRICGFGICALWQKNLLVHLIKIQLYGCTVNLFSVEVRLNLSPHFSLQTRILLLIYQAISSLPTSYTTDDKKWKFIRQLKCSATVSQKLWNIVRPKYKDGKKLMFRGQLNFCQTWTHCSTEWILKILERAVYSDWSPEILADT